MKHRKANPFLLYGFIVILLLRLVMVFTMGMMPQDAYYYFYSEHLSLSYFDHPPGIAVIIWFGTKIFGTEVWSLKLIDFIVTGIALYCMLLLARRFLPEGRSKNAVLILGSTLLITNPSIVATPDVPLLLVWTVALLAIHHALHAKNISRGDAKLAKDIMNQETEGAKHDNAKNGVLWWFLAGFVSGLAFDCKYTAIFLPAGLVCYLLLSTAHRRHLFSWRFLLYCIAFLIAISPVVIWNMQHDFASFQFQSGDRVSSILEFKLQPVFFLAVIGHQMALLLPVLAIAIGVTFWKWHRKSWKERKSSVPALPAGRRGLQSPIHSSTLFLLSFSLPLILTFLAISWLYWVKINWMIPAYITATILTARYMKLRWMKWQMGIALFANFLLCLQIAFYLIPMQSDDTYWGWETVANEVNIIHEQYPGHFIFSRDGYKTTAILNYYLDEKVYAGNILGEPALEYSITDADLSHLRGRNALFIDSRRLFKDFEAEYVPPESLKMYFEEIRMLPRITLYGRDGKVLRQFAVVECRGYRGVR